jgi:hypothetical protein
LELWFKSKIRIDFVMETIQSAPMKDPGFRRPLEVALYSALSYLDGLDSMPVASRVDLATVRHRLAKPLTDDGVLPEVVVADLARDVEGAMMTLRQLKGRTVAALLRSCASGKENMKSSRRMFRALAVTVFLAVLTLVASAQTSIFQVVPTPNQNEFNNALNASSASSPNDIWAVGNTTIHFDGKRWKVFPAPGGTVDSPISLRGVLTFSPTLAWAGGGGDDKGQIIDQWNGKKWERLQGLPFPPAWNPLVMTMSGTSTSDVWVTPAATALTRWSYTGMEMNGQLFRARTPGTTRISSITNS